MNTTNHSAGGRTVFGKWARGLLCTMLKKAKDAFVRLFSWLWAWIYDCQAYQLESKGGIAARRRELISTVPHGGALLEIGAGTGATLNAGAYEGAESRFSRITLVEPDRGMRQRMEKKLKNRQAQQATSIEIVGAALPNLPFDDNQFDAVACFFVLSHVPDRADALKEIVRLLKVGGKLLFIDHGIHEHSNHHHRHHGRRGREKEEKNKAKTGGEQHADSAPDHDELVWFKEWLRFGKQGHKGAKVDFLLDDIKKEENLEEDFVSRTKVKMFGDMCYGSFTRKEHHTEQQPAT